jgi:hypothetical protein
MAKKSNAGRPPKFKTAEEMQEVVDAYFNDCDTNEEPYTITGLALALDMTRESLVNYENRDEFFSTVKRAKLKCQNYAEKFLYSGKNATGAIFNLKNNYGWKDKHENELTGKDGGPIETKWEIIVHDADAPA